MRREKNNTNRCPVRRGCASAMLYERVRTRCSEEDERSNANEKEKFERERERACEERSSSSFLISSFHRVRTEKSWGEIGGSSSNSGSHTEHNLMKECRHVCECNKLCKCRHLSQSLSLSHTHTHTLKATQPHTHLFLR